jgi:antitoxin CcdA
MIKYRKEKITSEVIDKVICEVCKTEYDCTKDFLEVQEIQHISVDGGFGSIFGDGVKLKADICQHCFKKIFGKYLVEDDGG